MQIVEISKESDQEQSSPVVGIDFGTTNSLIALMDPKSSEVRYLQVNSGAELLPSIVSFQEDGRIRVGDRSIKTNSVRSVKRLLAKSFDEVRGNPSLHALCHDTLAKGQNDMPEFKAGDEQLSPVQVASKIFSFLKESAEASLGHEIKRAVVSVPAYFNDTERGAVLAAAKLAGFDVLRLIAEPTAAAYAYGMNKRAEGSYLVYDFGGGTFDVSILSMSQGVLQVVACGGDNMLGGDNVDYEIAGVVASKLGAKGIKPTYLSFAKKFKELLSTEEYATLEIEGQEISFTRGECEEAISGLIARTVKIAKGVHFDAENIPLDGVILVGGSTRIPMVKQALKEVFRVEIYDDIDPDRAVAAGAAMQGWNLTSRGGSLLIDVVPLSLGIELYGGIAEKVIMRNTPIPFSTKREFTTYADNQTGMKLHVLQGEREMVDDCRSLARFELKNLPAKQAGRVKVEVNFAIDADGILSVGARDKDSGNEAEIEIKPTYGINEDSIAESLEDAFSNARKDHEKRLFVETRLEAEELIEGIKGALAKTPDILESEEVQRIEEAINSLQKAINPDNYASNDFTLQDRDLVLAKINKLNSLAASFIEKHLNFGADKMLMGKNINEIGKKYGG